MNRIAMFAGAALIVLTLMAASFYAGTHADPCRSGPTVALFNCPR